jgi:PAS domain S-box-containing protein
MGFGARQFLLLPNHAWRAITGYENGCERWGDFVQEDDRSRLWNSYMAAAEHLRPLREKYRLRRPNGDYVLVHTQAEPHYSDGRYAGFIGISNEIDEAGVLVPAGSSFPVMLWKTGPETGCTYLNEVWQRFTGRPVEQDLGFGWVDCIHAGDLPVVRAIYIQAFEKRQPFAVEYRLRRADGTYGWIRGQGRPDFAPSGEFLGYVGSAFEIASPKTIISASAAA